jgi:hypothetical protein
MSSTLGVRSHRHRAGRSEDAAAAVGSTTAPVELGRGERLWHSHEDLLDRFHLDAVPSPSGVTHLLFWHKER